MTRPHPVVPSAAVLGTLVAAALTVSACGSRVGESGAASPPSTPPPSGSPMSGHLAYGQFVGSGVSLFTVPASAATLCRSCGGPTARVRGGRPTDAPWPS